MPKLLRSAVLLILLGGLSAIPIPAQDTKEEPRKDRATDTRPVERTTQVEQPTEGDASAPTGTDAGSIREGIRERIRRAIRLPEAVEESREAGVPEERIRDVLESARTRGVPAGDIKEIIEIENEAIRQGGDPDNFGAAVQEMKASGLRGRELAEAIHAEQYARGMKKPKHDKKAKGRGYESEEYDEGVEEELERGSRNPDKKRGKGKGGKKQ